jgi:hypothetical protein
MRENLLGEILVLIRGRAESDGFSVVIDVAAENPSLMTPSVLFRDNKKDLNKDLTGDVLRQLNAALPPEALKLETKNRSIQGQNQLKQQWFWFRAGSTAKDPINANDPAASGKADEKKE